MRIVCFAYEVIKDRVRCMWFYEIVKRVGDFV